MSDGDSVVAEFLATTNSIYEECARGIGALDRIIVGTPSSLAPECRMALVPALYAYWERFFRVVMGEFLRCVGLAKAGIHDVSPPLAKLRIGREIRARVELRASEVLHERLTRAGAHGAKAAAEDLNSAVAALCQMFSQPVAFQTPEDWIETESNVRYRVIERSCRAVGIEPSNLKAHVPELNLFMALESPREHSKQDRPW